MRPSTFLTLLAFAADVLADSSVTFTTDGSAPLWYVTGSPFVVLDNSIAFVFQSDGNFVVYDGGASRVLWNSGSTGHACQNYGDCVLNFQGDGNFVARAGQQAFWTTGTNSFKHHPSPAYYLVLQNSDPYVTLYDNGWNREWFSHGDHGFVSQNPDGPDGPAPPGGNGGNGDPCAGLPNCMSCFESCGGGCVSGCSTDPQPPKKL